MIANHLPKKIVYHCGIRIWADVTCNQFRDKDVSSVTMADAMKVWQYK